MTIGIDVEQFIRDPYATGIQRVLQQLALHWPAETPAWFVVPDDAGRYLLLTPAQAAALLSLPFTEHRPAAQGHDANHDLRQEVESARAALSDDREVPKVTMGMLLSMVDAWLLPEVSYLPSVLQRIELFARCMPVAMIGYDTLPMTEPANYRFVPGRGADVSAYFRMMARADAVICISEYARESILRRLRRDLTTRTIVAHPGGDHLEIRYPSTTHRAVGPTRFIRLGTMEARKRPLEILRGFLAAVESGVDAELVFIGNPSASSQAINDEVRRAIRSGWPVRWIQGASDREVYELVADADAFLSIGVEGYGIPVLEAIRLGTPVLFDGIQPAGDLMVGRGARQVPASDAEALRSLFADHAVDLFLRDLREQLRPDAVPTWADFASAVAHAIR